jgi:hypothetical protein
MGQQGTKNDVRRERTQSRLVGDQHRHCRSGAHDAADDWASRLVCALAFLYFTQGLPWKPAQSINPRLMDRAGRMQQSSRVGSCNRNRRAITGITLLDCLRCPGLRLANGVNVACMTSHVLPLAGRAKPGDRSVFEPCAPVLGLLVSVDPSSEFAQVLVSSGILCHFGH